jgi:hypothetical protein
VDGPDTLATVSTSSDPDAVRGWSSSPTSGPAQLTMDEVVAAATAVLEDHAGSTPQEQATAVRSWWLDNTSADGQPPCAFAVLSLVLPAPAFAIAFQAHFDAATTPPPAGATPGVVHQHGHS